MKHTYTELESLFEGARARQRVCFSLANAVVIRWAFREMEHLAYLEREKVQG